MSDETTTEEISTETSETDERDWKAEAEKWQTLARKNEERAKSNAQAAKELDKVRASAMTETEKAVAEAKAAGMAEAARVAGPRLVRAEFRAAAAGQVDKETLDAYLEDVDLTRFLDDAGEPDVKAIAARIKRLGGGRTAASFDGGARTSAPAGADMNALLRQTAGRQ
jgi:hypothetical protein